MLPRTGDTPRYFSDHGCVRSALGVRKKEKESAGEGRVVLTTNLTDESAGTTAKALRQVVYV